jgi:hypothetical protein
LRENIEIKRKVVKIEKYKNGYMINKDEIHKVNGRLMKRLKKIQIFLWGVNNTNFIYN